VRICARKHLARAAGEWDPAYSEVRAAADLHLEHAKAVLRFVEGDALDRARQSLKRGPLIAPGWLKHLVFSASRPHGIKVFVLPSGPSPEWPSSSPWLFPSCSGLCGAILVLSNCPVSVRLGPHHWALVMRHVEGACDVTDAFGTVLSSFKTPPAQAHEVARRPPQAGSRDDPRAAGGAHRGSSCSTDQGAAEGARISSAVRSLRSRLRTYRFQQNYSRHADLWG
jgi:hypothetical protein